MCSQSASLPLQMSEYSIASGDKTYAQKALNLFKDILRFVNTPGILAPKYCENVEMQGHSITMILINTASRIREAIQAEELDAQIDLSLETFTKIFHSP